MISKGNKESSWILLYVVFEQSAYNKAKARRESRAGEFSADENRLKVTVSSC